MSSLPRVAVLRGVAAVPARRAGRVREGPHSTGSTRTHIVAPPGSGKTLLGVELIRRVGKRALVLAPNQGIQQQWPRAVGSFTDRPNEIAGADPLKPIACLSYQALCQLEDPEILLGRLAQSRWADERAAATGMTPEEALREGEAFEGEAADRRARELSRISAALKREVARGEHAGVELRDLLARPPAARVQQLAKMGVGVVLLDECHHLASPVGLRRPRRAAGAAGGRARDRPHRDAAGRPPRGRGRALRRAARPRRLHRPHARPSSATATSRPTRSSRCSPSRWPSSATGSPSTTRASASWSRTCTTATSPSG